MYIIYTVHVHVCDLYMCSDMHMYTHVHVQVTYHLVTKTTVALVSKRMTKTIAILVSKRYVLVSETTAVLGTKLQMDGQLDMYIYRIDKIHTMYIIIHLA